MIRLLGALAGLALGVAAVSLVLLIDTRSDVDGLRDDVATLTEQAQEVRVAARLASLEKAAADAEASMKLMEECLPELVSNVEDVQSYLLGATDRLFTARFSRSCQNLLHGFLPD